MGKRGPKPKGPLDSEHRRKMLRIVAENPGIGIMDLMAHFTFQWGSFYHHLTCLRDAQYLRIVTDAADQRRRRIHLGGAADDLAAFAPSRLESTARTVALLIVMNPGADLDVLGALAVEIPTRTMYYHARRLIDAGLVTSGSDTRYVGLLASPALYRALDMPEPGQPLPRIR